MPVSVEYTWSETDSQIEVVIPLKGVSLKKVDVFTASSILKVSFAPFLLDLNLLREIEENKSRAVFKNGTLKIRLEKKEAESWRTLCFQGSKEEIKQRRRKAMEERESNVQKQMEKVAAKKVEEERMVFQRHMALQEEERQRLDTVKETVKKRAEDEMYDTFSRLQNAKARETTSTKKVNFKSECDMKDQSINTLNTSSPENKDTNHKSQDCNEEGDYESESTIPPPRNVVHKTFRHTPRLFKTPSRESTVKREQEFIMKNRSKLKKNALLNHSDISDVDPVWLSAKGDEFYSRCDFYSAINAYSEALEVDKTMIRTLSNRAACFLHLREGTCCIKDCLAVLEMNDAIESQFNAVIEQEQFRKENHIRLALASCLNGEYADGVQHFSKAHDLDEDDCIPVDSIGYIENLMKASELKTRADASFAEGDLARARDLYSEALSADPTFAKALMNRAACQLALKNGANCVSDCTRALELISAGKTKKSATCLVAAILFPKPEVRRKWEVTLLCRRAAAERLSGHLKRALADLEDARSTVRAKDDIDVETVEKSIASLKNEMAA